MLGSFIRSDVIRYDVIRSVFIRSDVIRTDVIRSVIIRSVGESMAVHNCWCGNLSYHECCMPITTPMCAGLVFCTDCMLCASFKPSFRSIAPLLTVSSFSSTKTVRKSFRAD
jgi:hypothetical protein